MKPPALPPLPAGRPVWPAPPPPAEGVVSWNMNTTCNYRCTYCTQRFLDDRGRWARDLPRFIEAFCRLPGAWEIKLSGGEPFIHPGFLDAVAALAARGFRVGVVTNFSADEATLGAFLDAAGPQLSLLSASLHLEYVGDHPKARSSVEDFIGRARFVNARLPARASLCVTCVATRNNLPLLPTLRTRFAQAGLVFKVQPEKQGREVVAYSPSERSVLTQLGGHNLTGHIAPDFGGQPCWAGARYFIVDDRGNAFRCYPARRYRTESMGNLLDESFRLADAPSPCLYRYCNCTVPIARGMMPHEAAHETAHTPSAHELP